jgi:TPP-dependent pyruvate/acetoin dehydrogenase alpha subunit
MGSKAFESPLISNARMRALYRGVTELRALAKQRKDKTLRNLEACFVAAAIDLQEGDLACDTGGLHEAMFVEHIRAVAQRSDAAAITRPELKRILDQLAEAKSDGFAGTATERLICAVGSAMALKASSENQNVVLAFARHADLSKSDWLRILTLLSQQGLPLILVALPGTTPPLDLEALARKATNAAGLARGLAVPVIPVDAGDPVAIYRVAQETGVRARASGGAAVIECLCCGTDPVKLLGKQLIRKEICTERWVKSVETHLTKLMAKK